MNIFTEVNVHPGCSYPMNFFPQVEQGLVFGWNEEDALAVWSNQPVSFNGDKSEPGWASCGWEQTGDVTECMAEVGREHRQ